MLQASPVMCNYANISNNFLQYGQGHYAILEAVRQIRISTNPIHISDGLLSEFFIMMQKLAESAKDPAPINAYRWLRDEVLNYIDLVHIHIRCMPGNDLRRMALSIIPKTVTEDSSAERWIVFERPDIAAIASKIMSCKRDAELSA